MISIDHELEDLPLDDKATVHTEDRGMLNTGLLKKWERRIEIGLDGSAGNSQNETFRSTLNLKYEDNDSRIHSETLYYVSKDDKETSENKASSNLTKDWLIKDSKWFFFSFSSLDCRCLNSFFLLLLVNNRFITQLATSRSTKLVYHQVMDMLFIN